MADRIIGDLMISNVTYKDTSKNANPRFTVVFTDGTSRNTEIDASVGYGISNPDFRDTPVEIWINNAGSITHIRTMDGRYQA